MISDRGPEQYYQRLRIGKIREAEVAVAIAEYALSLSPGVRLSLYSPDIDIDAIDAVLRVETDSSIQLLELQVTSAGVGRIQLSRLLRTMEKHDRMGSDAGYLIICCSGRQTIDELMCFESSKLLKLSRRNGRKSVTFSDYSAAFGRCDLKSYIERITARPVPVG